MSGNRKTSIIFDDTEIDNWIHPFILNFSPNPNKWDLLGGGLEKDETYEEAARREIEEETNLKVDKLRLLKEREVVHNIQGREYKIVSHIFMTEVEILEEDIKFYEGQEIGWFTFEEIQQMNISSTILPLILEFENKI